MGRRSRDRGEAEIDWGAVKKLAAMQATCEEIAYFLEVSDDFLEKQCKRTYGHTIGVKIKEWRTAGNCSLRRKQWLLADKSASMAIFLGKNYLGQKDESKVQHAGQVVVEVMNYGDGKLRPYERKGFSDANAGH